ncbi:MAG: TonB-dependent receptor [Bacteroidota bacterium]|nr:TonB-dependent receptor [Bacteroidota bacterium]MDP4190521.1 TonB-dependent receptor [Bacteroidota bacterium]
MQRFTRISFWLTTLMLLLILASTENLSAQTTGIIRGSVKQSDGTAVPYATVTLLNTPLGAASDAQGNYLITKVPAGSYRLRASAIGYKTTTQSITVTSGGTATQNFTLAPDVLNMQTVVVTGTISPIPKQESSVAISTLTPLQLEQANPRSTTEVLRYVPGFTRVESSGGEVNENISVRGILGVEYVMFMEDGLPVFPTMHTFFMNADNLFRDDENIQGVEVVRGGNSALFGSNTPGAIINFINKTGGPSFGGVVKASGGTEGLARYDFNVNGPFTEDLRFNLGGFYRFDRGVRYPGFPGVRGGQLKGSITKLLDNGYIKTSFKVIDDRNQFILPLPFQNPDDPTFVPGFSRYGAMNTEEANNVAVPTPSGDMPYPLEDGLRTQAYWLTGDVSFNFTGDWTLRNMAQYMQNNQGWNGIFTGQPTNATEWVNSLKLPAGTTYGLFYTNYRDPVTGKKLPFDMTANDGLAFLSPSTLVTVQKPMSAFQDQVQIQTTINKKHTISMGLYFANYTQTNRWSFGDILMDVRDNPRLVDLVTYRGGDTVAYTQNGFRNFVSLYRNGTGTTTIFSAMLGGSFQLLDRLRLDLGGRYETDDYVQSAENQTTVDLDANPATIYNNEQWGNKTFRHFSRTINDWALSGGLNFALTDQVAIYAQASRAYKMPALDEFLDAQAQDQINLFENRRVYMYEGGVKFSLAELAFTLNGFWVKLTNNVGQGFEINPATGLGRWVIRTDPDSRSYGAEFELSFTPILGLNFLGVGTYTKAETVEAAGAALTAGGIPKFIGNFTLSYNLMGFAAYADFHYVGARDLVNAIYDQTLGRYTTYQAFQTLPSYNYMNLGLSYTIPNQGLRLNLDLLNVYQSLGLEEGNPRLPGVKAFYFVARPILPRRLTASLRYAF